MEFPDVPKHKIIQRLGAGGMAHIYLADHTFLKTKVAVKVMAPDLYTDPAYAERFLREARIAAQLDHPNIVRVRDGGEVGNLHYLTMEYLDGGNLRDDMREGMELADTLKVCKEIARALQYLSTKNFVHRDLKPENVLLRKDKTPVLCDFGIAKEIEKRDSKFEDLTAGPMMIGTLSYMSPEQAWGDPVDGRSDIYSLGVILYEMLTGSVPLRGDNRAEHREMLLSRAVPPLPADISPLQSFVEKALAKHPDDRFQSGAEFIAALDKLEEQEYDLIHSGRTTISLEDNTDVTPKSALSHLLTRLRGAFSNQRKLSNRKSNSSALRRIRSQKAVRRRKIILLGGAGSIIAAGGLWLMLQDDGLPTSSEGADRSRLINAGTDPSPGQPLGNVEELLRKGRQAIDEGRYYGRKGDDAETHLTNLLVLHPNHEQGKQEIERLFTLYLEQAAAALNESDLPRSQELLRQTTLISDLIENRELVSRSIDLRAELSALRKQRLIADQRRQSIEKLLKDAEKLRSQGNATSPPGTSAYDKYRQALSLDPENEAARAGIMGIATDLLQLARKHLLAAEITTAEAYVNAAVQVNPQHPDIKALGKEIQAAEERIARQKIEAELKDSKKEKERLAAREKAQRETQAKIKALLLAAKEDIAAGRLGTPHGSNAIEKYNEVVSLDSANSEAVAGFEAVAEKYIDLATQEIEAGDLKSAERQLISAQILSPTNPRFIEVQSALINAKDRRERNASVERERRERVSALLKAARSANKKGNYFNPRGDNAMESLRNVLELDKDNPQALKLRSEILQSVTTMAKTNIENRRLSEAKIAIAALTANGAATSTVKALQRQLDDKVKQITEENQKAALEKSAKERALQKQLADQKAEQQRLAKLKAEQARAKEEARLARKKAEEKAREIERERAEALAAKTLLDLERKKAAELARQEALELEEKRAEELAIQSANEASSEYAQESAQLAKDHIPLKLTAAQKLDNQVDGLMEKAAILGQVSSTNYRELRDIYTSVLTLKPEHTAAQKELARVAAQSDKLAQRFIKARKFETARSEIAWLSANIAKSEKIAPLRESLAYAERQSKQASELLDEAENLTNTAYKKPGLFGNNNAAIKVLKTAFDKIAAAKHIDSGNPAIATAEKGLIDRYGEIIGIHLEDESDSEAREFMDALLQTGLTGSAINAMGARVSQLEAEQDNASAPSVPTF